MTPQIRGRCVFLNRGNSSVGRAQPCQGWGREFESRFPLQVVENLSKVLGFCFFRLGGRMVMQRPAKPWTPVRFRPQPVLEQERQPEALLFLDQLLILNSPGGGTGRRKGLKIPRDLIPCRFDSGLGQFLLS